MMKVLSSGLEKRHPGKTPKIGVSIIAGQPVRLDPADGSGATIMLAQGGCTVGFALETNVTPISPSYFYDDYSRGGLLSYAAGAGQEFEVSNDVRGEVFVTTDTFTIGAKLYSNVDGKLSVTVLGDAVGIVTKVPANALDTLVFQSLI